MCPDRGRGSLAEGPVPSSPVRGSRWDPACPPVDPADFYDPIPSEIRTIHRRGCAGRGVVERIVVLVTEATRDEAFARAGGLAGEEDARRHEGDGEGGAGEGRRSLR
jgi:hypothetical protein